MLSSNYRSSHLGTVEVKSGKLVILDPEQLIKTMGDKPLDTYDLNYQAKAAILADENGAAICNDRAVAFDAQVQTAEVFADYDEHGNITRIEIRLEES